jgi:two-component system chemotaxis response regulator CheY
MRSLLVDVLTEAGYEVSEAGNGAEALVLLHRDGFGAILLDKNMPGLSGMDLLPGFRVICPATPVIMITAFGDGNTAAEGRARGARACLFKPFRMDDLLTMLENVISQPAPGADVPVRVGGEL